MTVGELKKLLDNFDNDLQVFTEKKEVFGNIGHVFSVQKDNYSTFGMIKPCVKLTDYVEDEDNF